MTNSLTLSLLNLIKVGQEVRACIKDKHTNEIKIIFLMYVRQDECMKGALCY